LQTERIVLARETVTGLQQGFARRPGGRLESFIVQEINIKDKER
jgi:hypothetical protein